MDLVQVWSKVAPLFTPVTMTSKIARLAGAGLPTSWRSSCRKPWWTVRDTHRLALDRDDPEGHVHREEVGVRTYASSEVVEDSVVPLVPFIINNAAKVLARGIEDAIINGESAV
jgi:hypothetical protein